MCKHEIHLLIGRADGIFCKGCGTLFKSFADINAQAEGAPQGEPKKPRKKKEDK